MSILKKIALAGLGLLALSGTASAEDRTFSYSVTLGGTSDYVFRGFSNSNRDPAAQGSIDFAYGIAYAGIWASNVSYPNFGGPVMVPGGDLGPIGPVEIDYYAGIKPVWGPLSFDLAVLYYTFPGQKNGPVLAANDADYLEFKGAVSGSPIQNLTLTASNYYSPDSQWGAGEVYTLEGSAAYTLPAVSIFTPTISATYGHQWSYDPAYVRFASAWGDDEYGYYNVGLALAVEKFTFDFRYWDTDLSTAADAACNFDSSTAGSFQCGPTFVFSAKVTLP